MTVQSAADLNAAVISHELLGQFGDVRAPPLGRVGVRAYATAQATLERDRILQSVECDLVTPCRIARDHSPASGLVDQIDGTVMLVGADENVVQVSDPFISIERIVHRIDIRKISVGSLRDPLDYAPLVKTDNFFRSIRRV